MIRIAIVDDDAAMLTLIQQNVERSLALEELEITAFTDGEKFLNFIRKGERFDLLLSDIDMPAIGGIALARAIRDMHIRMYLVFLTAYTNYALQSYEVEAYQYILKEQMENRMPNILGQLAEKIKREREQFQVLGSETDRKKVYDRDIICIRKSKSAKYVEYIMADEVCKERKTLEQVRKSLKSDEFILVERSCIVNMMHIKRMKGTVIYMDNDEQISVSRARFAKVKEQLSQYWGNR